MNYILCCCFCVLVVWGNFGSIPTLARVIFGEIIKIKCAINCAVSVRSCLKEFPEVAGGQMRLLLLLLRASYKSPFMSTSHVNGRTCSSICASWLPDSVNVQIIPYSDAEAASSQRYIKDEESLL